MTDWQDREEYNYSEYTLDYDNTKFIIYYHDPTKSNKSFSYEIEITNYNNSFANLVKDIAALMV